MKLEVYERNILKNYKYIQKLEEIIPLKKAEIELKLWNIIKEKLKTFFDIEIYDFVENSSEYLLQNHIDILSFELENLKLYYKKPVYLGIGRYFNKEGIYFFISDDFLNNKDKKYVSLLNTLKDNNNLKEWHSNGKNLYIDFSKNINFGNLFNFEYDDFYNLLEDKQLYNIADTIVKLFCEEYEKLSTIKL